MWVVTAIDGDLSNDVLPLTTENAISHAVSRLRDLRLSRSVKPFLARGLRAPRCPHCRVIFSHCLCNLRPQVPTRAGVCLIMGDIEALKPTNTGWLIADVVQVLTPTEN